MLRTRVCGLRRMKGKTIKAQLRGAANAAEDASNSGTFVVVARTGFVVSGVLHLLVGAIAIQLAFGKSQQADQGGAMAQLGGQPGGVFLLWLGFTACIALALWQLSEAVFSYRRLNSKRKLGKKLSAAGQAVVFAAIAVAFASFALGAGKNTGQATSDSTARLMKAPLGAALLIAIGAVIAVVGIVFVIRGLRTSFKEQLSLPASGPASVATVQADPEESTGLDGALRAVREQPFGTYLLTLMEAGLIYCGLYQIVKARFAPM
ncbi:MAG: DUF1206 domain-containing protein [Specibacter sp.]